MYEKSKSLFERAQRSIPGGVNSPVRAFKSVGGDPVFIKKASGAYLYDVDGNRYVDYIASWGPMILGHAYAPVVQAICRICFFLHLLWSYLPSWKYKWLNWFAAWCRISTWSSVW